MRKVVCRACGKAFAVSDEFAGRTARCRDCGWEIPMPSAPPLPVDPGDPSAGPPCLESVAAAPEARQVAPSASTSPLAVAALVLGLLGCLFPLGVIALILGIAALKEIGRAENRLTGRGLAVAGVIIGGINTAAFVASVLVIMLMLSSTPSPQSLGLF